MGSRSGDERRAVVWFPLGGSACRRGTSGVEHDLGRLPGALEAGFNPRTGIAYLVYDRTVTDPSRLAAAIRGAGYAAGMPMGTEAMRGDRTRSPR